MQDDRVRLATRLGLKTQTDPALAFVGAREVSRSNRIAKREKAGVVTALFVKSLDKQVVFFLQHRLDPVPGDVPAGLAVDFIADLHVVG